MKNLVQNPLDGHSRSLYTSKVHEHYSIAQLTFIIAKLVAFVLKKPYKYFPATNKIPDEMNKALPKHVPSSTNLEILTVPLAAFIQQPPPSYVLQSVIPDVCINSFSCPTDKLNTEISNLLRPHVELSPNTDPIGILNDFVDTYCNLQSLLQLRSTDIQTLTLSTIHVNDFLKNPVLLETPHQITNT